MYDALRRTAIFFAGFGVILVGMAFWFLPGPGWLIVFLGLLILASEFAFARRLLDKVRHLANRGAQAVRMPLHWRRRLRLEPPEGGSQAAEARDALRR